MVSVKTTLASLVVAISVKSVIAAIPCSAKLEKLEGTSENSYHKHEHRISTTADKVWYNWYVQDPVPGFNNKLTGDFIYMDPLPEDGKLTGPTTSVTLFIDNEDTVERSVQIALHDKNVDAYPEYVYTLTAAAGETRQECFLMDKSLESKAISFQAF